MWIQVHDSKTQALKRSTGRGPFVDVVGGGVWGIRMPFTVDPGSFPILDWFEITTYDPIDCIYVAEGITHEIQVYEEDE